MKKKVLMLTVILLALVVLVMFTSMLIFKHEQPAASDVEPTEPTQVTEPVEKVTRSANLDIKLIDVDGDVFSLKEFAGRIIILNFMATGCPVCGQQIDQLKKIADEYSDQVVIISISVQDSSETLRQYVEKHGIGWIVARDPLGIAFYEYGVKVIPTTVIIDQEGHIAFRHEGFVSASTLAEEIDRLLGGK
jgi:cytochrome oxidase Cu insertion factor (SCO1/SenC/PrrC family)